MSGLFYASYVVLWVVVIVLAILSATLFRQLGVFVLGTARGANESGIHVGRRLPSPQLTTVDDTPWSPAMWRGRRFLMFFAGDYCDECKGVAEPIRQIAAREGMPLVVMAFADDELAARPFRDEWFPDAEVVYVSQETGHEFDATVVPFLYVVDEEGIVRSKGIASRPEVIEQLLSAAVPATRDAPVELTGSGRR